jgi:hypothetical protein
MTNTVRNVRTASESTISDEVKVSELSDDSMSRTFRTHLRSSNIVTKTFQNPEAYQVKAPSPEWFFTLEALIRLHRDISEPGALKVKALNPRPASYPGKLRLLVHLTRCDSPFTRETKIWARHIEPVTSRHHPRISRQIFKTR